MQRLFAVRRVFFVVGVVVVGSVGGAGSAACGPTSLIGTACTDVPSTEIEICEGTQRLRCDGNTYQLLATCHHSCVVGEGTAHAAGEVGSDETWTCAGSPHVINGNVSVASGAVLTIEPGAAVRLQPTTRVTIPEGARVVIDATPGAEGLFTSNNGLAGGFGGNSVGGLNVFATAEAEPSIIRGLIVERGINGITISGVSDRSDELPVIERCTFRDNTRFGILVNCEGGDVEVPDYALTGNQFFENGSGDVSTCASLE